MQVKKSRKPGAESNDTDAVLRACSASASPQYCDDGEG